MQAKRACLSPFVIPTDLTDAQKNFLCFQRKRELAKRLFLVLVLAIPVKAIAAVHGAITAGLERHLSGYAATVANDFVHLPFATAGVLGVTAGRAATGATAGLVLEAFVSKELLLTG